MITIILISSAIGFLSSLLSSMLGGGFGLISVPAIYWLAVHYYPTLDYPMQISITTGTASAIILGVIASYKHSKYGNINYPLFKKTYIPMMIGISLGVACMISINSETLKSMFAFIVLLVAILFSRLDLSSPRNIHVNLCQHSILSLFLSFFSVLFGISIFNVPYFVFLGYGIKESIGTSSTLVALYSTIALILLMLLGVLFVGADKHHIGYLLMPVFLAIIIPGLIGTILGAKLVKFLSQDVLKKLFVTIIFIASIAMMFQ